MTAAPIHANPLSEKWASASVRRRRGYNAAIDDCDILILARNSQVATRLENGLLASCRHECVRRAVSVEMALQIAAEHRVKVAFLDCSLSDAVFRKILQGGPSGTQVRIIGLRVESGPLRAIDLMSRQLIAAYVSLPVTLVSLEALVRKSCSFLMPRSVSIHGVVA